MSTPYDVPLGEGDGSCAFRLMPADGFHTGSSAVSVAEAAQLLMRNGVPETDEGPATRYETTRGRWA
jgi:hypothetical protein